MTLLHLLVKKNIHEILGINQDQSLDIFKKFPENELYLCRVYIFKIILKISEGLFEIVNQRELNI